MLTGTFCRFSVDLLCGDVDLFQGVGSGRSVGRGGVRSGASTAEQRIAETAEPMAACSAM